MLNIYIYYKSATVSRRKLRIAGDDNYKKLSTKPENRKKSARYSRSRIDETNSIAKLF